MGKRGRPATRKFEKKFCSACGKYKSPDEFHPGTGTKYGWRGVCESCFREGKKPIYLPPEFIHRCVYCGRIYGSFRRRCSKYCRHPACVSERSRVWREENKDKIGTRKRRKKSEKKLRKCRAMEVLGFKSSLCDGYIHNDNRQICHYCQRMRDKTMNTSLFESCSLRLDC